MPDEHWTISTSQQKLLDSLFAGIMEPVKNVLDVGSGRTSIAYLAERYKHLQVVGIVYPGDARKTGPIRECVKSENYTIIEADFAALDLHEQYDVVLAHLFLGEAEKFSKGGFAAMVAKLFTLKTRYLVMVNLFRDAVDYNVVFKAIAEKGGTVKVAYAKSEDGDECIGLTIKF